MKKLLFTSWICIIVILTGYARHSGFTQPLSYSHYALILRSLPFINNNRIEDLRKKIKELENEWKKEPPRENLDQFDYAYRLAFNGYKVKAAPLC